jgi:hypothetical protein
MWFFCVHEKWFIVCLLSKLWICKGCWSAVHAVMQFWPTNSFKVFNKISNTIYAKTLSIAKTLCNRRWSVYSNGCRSKCFAQYMIWIVEDYEISCRRIFFPVLMDPISWNILFSKSKFRFWVKCNSKVRGIVILLRTWMVVDTVLHFEEYNILQCATSICFVIVLHTQWKN